MGIIENAIKAAQAAQQKAVTASKSSSRSSTSKSSSPAKASTAAPAKAPTVSDSEMAEKYGYTKAFMDAYPEIGTLIRNAVAGDWTSDRFQAALRNTNFWKNTNEQSRKMAALWTSDPAEWGALWARTQMHVISILGELGGPTGDWSVIQALSGKIINEGWNDERVRQEAGSYIVFGNGGMAGGKAGEVQQELNSYMYSMGVKNADWWIQGAVRGVVSGKNSIDDFKRDIINQAMASFPGFTDQIKAGQTVSDIAQPYMQSMSQILEIAPGNINLFDPTIKNALSYKDKAGIATSKPLWQFQNDLRSDDRWKKTQNAQDSVMGTAHTVLQQFGIYS